MTKLVKLAIVTKRPMVVLGCIAWLTINLVSFDHNYLVAVADVYMQMAQAAIAMLSLTYGFNTDYTAVQLSPGGNVSIPSMGHFFPQYSYRNSSNPSIQDEEYAAHM